MKGHRLIAVVILISLLACGAAYAADAIDPAVRLANAKVKINEFVDLRITQLRTFKSRVSSSTLDSQAKAAISSEIDNVISNMTAYKGRVTAASNFVEILQVSVDLMRDIGGWRLRIAAIVRDMRARLNERIANGLDEAIANLQDRITRFKSECPADVQDEITARETELAAIKTDLDATRAKMADGDEIAIRLELQSEHVRLVALLSDLKGLVPRCLASNTS